MWCVRSSGSFYLVKDIVNIDVEKSQFTFWPPDISVKSVSRLHELEGVQSLSPEALEPEYARNEPVLANKISKVFVYILNSHY